MVSTESRYVHSKSRTDREHYLIQHEKGRDRGRKAYADPQGPHSQGKNLLTVMPPSLWDLGTPREGKTVPHPSNRAKSADVKGTEYHGDLEVTSSSWSTRLPPQAPHRPSRSCSKQSTDLRTQSPYTEKGKAQTHTNAQQSLLRQLPSFCAAATAPAAPSSSPARRQRDTRRDGLLTLLKKPSLNRRAQRTRPKGITPLPPSSAFGTEDNRKKKSCAAAAVAEERILLPLSRSAHRKAERRARPSLARSSSCTSAVPAAGSAQGSPSAPAHPSWRAARRHGAAHGRAAGPRRAHGAADTGLRGSRLRPGRCGALRDAAPVPGGPPHPRSGGCPPPAPSRAGRAPPLPSSAQSPPPLLPRRRRRSPRLPPHGAMGPGEAPRRSGPGGQEGGQDPPGAALPGASGSEGRWRTGARPREGPPRSRQPPPRL